MNVIEAVPKSCRSDLVEALGKNISSSQGAACLFEVEVGGCVCM